MDDFTVQMVLKWLHDNRGLIAAHAQTKNLRRDVKGLQADIRQGFRQALQHVDRFAAGLVRGGKRTLLLGGILATAFTAGIVKISEAGANLESYQVTLQQLYGDAQQAGEAMDWIMGMQVRTPYTPEELLSALKPLKVFGMDAEKWLPAIGDMASTMGKDITDAATGVAKAFSAGQAGADALRESYGVTMANLVKVSGYTEKELREDMNKYRDALFTFITDPKFAGGMKRYAQTFKGVLSSIKGGFQTFTMFLGREINNVMKADFQKVVDWIVRAYESGKLEEWARRAAEGFRMIWQGLKKAGEVLWKFVRPIVNFFKEHPQMLKWAIAAVAASAAISVLGGGVMMLTGKLWQLGRGLAGGIGRLFQFGKGLKGLFANIKAGGGLGNVLGGFLSGKGGILGKLGGVLTGGGGLAAVLGPVAGILAGIGAAVGLFVTAWKKNFAGIREATRTAFAPLTEIFKGQGIKNFQDFIKVAGAKFREVWEGIAKAVAPVFKIVIQIIGFVIRIGKALAPVGRFVAKLQLGIVMGVLKGVFWLLEKIFKLLEPVLEGISWVFDQINYGFRIMSGEAQKDMQIVQAELSSLQDKQKHGVKLTEDEIKRLKELQGKYAELKQEIDRWPALTKFWTDVREGGKEAFDKVRENARFNFGLVKLLGERAVERLKKKWDEFKQKWAEFKTAAANAWDAVNKKAAEVVKKIKGFFSNVWDSIKGPILAAKDWLANNIFKPIGDFFGNLFKPFRDAFQKALTWIADLVSKAPGVLKKIMGITDADLASLRAWAAQTGPMGPLEPGKLPSEQGAGVTPPGADEAAAAAAAAGGGGTGGGGGGGPTINNNITHNHLANGAIIITTSNIEQIKKALKELFDAEALSAA